MNHTRFKGFSANVKINETSLWSLWKTEFEPFDSNMDFIGKCAEETNFKPSEQSVVFDTKLRELLKVKPWSFSNKAFVLKTATSFPNKLYHWIFSRLIWKTILALSIFFKFSLCISTTNILSVNIKYDVFSKAALL